MSKKNLDSRVEKLKSNKKRKKLLFILVPIIVFLTATSAYAYTVMNKAENAITNSYEDDGRDKSELREKEVDPTEDHVSILFIGVDDSEHRSENGGSSSLSDALILATLNKDLNSVKLLSIPRDSYVYIPEVDKFDKITHAHSFGGPKATIETVENFLEVPVDYYVKLDFHAFIDVIDALNGVTINVPYELYEMDSNDTKNAIHLLPGEQLLNGEEALALARTRKLDNDIERGKRQQDIIKAIMDKSLSASSILKYDEIIQAVGDNMSTNMNFDQMKGFISYGTSGSLDIETLNLKGSDLWTDRYYYQIDEQDLEQKKQSLQEHLDLNVSKEMTSLKVNPNS
ncbi:LCP family protein [Aquibacillus rhizosphaerae]|uniref:LCP family protein n=1 Tax=Aquibacillus rhizosphaerae TaxID=3051431 RepID=A0ABT7KZJ6_9BACI|nr:LCP family protein [Aquibacillus sp. LR5S19]MDL4838898.1 LCP family protein [Aquibacillus sp. LR5S19]